MSIFSKVLGLDVTAPQVKRSPLRDEAEANTAAMGATFNTLAGNGQAGYNTSEPWYKQALMQRRDFLETDPNTDSRNAMDLGHATASTAGWYENAKARIAASAAKRGIGGGIVAGQETAVENARAGQYASAANNLYYRNTADRDRRSSDLLGLASGARTNDLNLLNMGIGGQRQVNNDLLGYAQGDEQRDFQNQQLTLQAQQAKIQQIMELIKQGGQIYGMSQGA